MTIIGLALTAALLAQTPPLPPQATQPVGSSSSVSGRVVSSGGPVAGAKVILTGSSGIIKTSATDEGGRFVFTKLPAGRYAVSVSSNGFAVTSFGGSASRAVSIDLEDGDHVDRGDLVLPTGVAITGQILDEDGKALKGATVSAWRTRYITPGERRLDFVGQAPSDKTGDYRIAGLKPGTYFVGATASDAIAPTFFPATATATMAAPITLTADIDAASIVIRLLSMPLATVSGSILNSQNLPSADFYVMLSPVRDDGAQVGSINLTSEVNAAGKFSVSKVPPGTYVVNVVAKSRLERLASTGGVGSRVDGEESGSGRVVVDGRDIDDVLVRTAPSPALSGKVTVDGAPISAEVARHVMITSGDRSGPSGMHSVMNTTFATPNAGGTFAMPVVPGGRLLRVNGLPNNTLLDRVLVNGIDVTDDGFDVGNAEIRDVLVALTTSPSRVTGRVANSQGAAVANAGVIIFPDTERRWQLVQTRFIKSAKTDKDGAFSFVGLPKGSYYAAVVPQLVDGEWADPANLQRLRQTAMSFTLSDGEQKTLALTLRK